MSERVRAVARNVRISPQKARLVASAIRGLPVGEAMGVLALSQKKAARLFDKVLRSAVANAEENHSLDVDNLMVVDARVDAGMTLKRYRPKGMGRMRRRFHRHSHLTVAVAEAN
ncbi:MAG: 50S ribosomal protein L22 [Zetaproteobacteria bacterium]|nr:MAG: 50S ribosomal protein L22 [Zetaproteobacteria bacterium]